MVLRRHLREFRTAVAHGVAEQKWLIACDAFIAAILTGAWYFLQAVPLKYCFQGAANIEMLPVVRSIAVVGAFFTLFGILFEGSLSLWFYELYTEVATHHQQTELFYWEHEAYSIEAIRRAISFGLAVFGTVGLTAMSWCQTTTETSTWTGGGGYIRLFIAGVATAGIAMILANALRGGWKKLASVKVEARIPRLFNSKN